MPTVAAIIVLILAGLMIFAKLGNRRIEASRKRRRRALKRYEGNEYEGVPS